MKLIFSFSLLLLFVSSAHPIDEESIVSQSRYWPDKVALREDLVLPNGVKLPVGWYGVLVRVQDDGVLLDYGGDGVHLVAAKSTDIVERAIVRREMILKVGEELVPGLYIQRLQNKFFLLDGKGGLRSSFAEDFNNAGYLLVVYANLSTELSGDDTGGSFGNLMAESDALFERGVAVITLTLDTDARELENAVIEWKWPYLTMFRWLTPSYIKMFALESSASGHAALMDSNGRLIVEGNVNQIVAEYKHLLADD